MKATIDIPDQLLTRRSRREGRSNDRPHRDALRRGYGDAPMEDPFDDWAGGIDGARVTSIPSSTDKVRRRSVRRVAKSTFVLPRYADRCVEVDD